MAAAAKQQKFKEESRIGIVLVKPTEKGSSILINTRAKNGSGGSEVRTSVLPGARNKYCPVLDAAKNFPGCTRDEFKKIKEELDLPEKLTYEEFWTLDKLPQVTLTDKPFKLNKAVLSDYIKYLVLLHHPWVASSNKSIEPQHRYVMVDEEQEAREYVSKIEKELAAFAIVHNMDMDERRQMLFWAYAEQGALGRSDSVVSQSLMQRIKNDPEWFLSHYNRDHKEERIILAKAVLYKVVQKSGSTYSFGEIILGTGEDEAAMYLAIPTNQPVLITIQKENRKLRANVI